MPSALLCLSEGLFLSNRLNGWFGKHLLIEFGLHCNWGGGLRFPREAVADALDCGLYNRRNISWADSGVGGNG